MSRSVKARAIAAAALRPRSGAAPWGTLPERPATLTEQVLRLIWQHRTISRAEIARRTDLSRSTVSEIVTALLSTKLVAEAGIGASRGGRRPIVLEFQDDAFVVLGVELGATHVAATLTDLRGRIVAWENRDHPVRSDPSGTGALILELAETCLASWGGRKQRLVGIGIAVPSPVDPAHPERLSALALPDWDGRNPLEGLRTHFEVPVLVDNDANLGALAERWWGACRGVDDFAYIKMATGIGSGHFVGGRIYRGSSGVAGEIGHLGLDLHGEPCVCGNRGCLVTYVGTPALEARARALLATHPESPLHATGATITAIEDAALADDRLATEVVHEAADRLGIAIAGMLNLMNPAAVILGGGLARLGDRLLVPLREAVLRRTFVSSMAASQIRTSELGERAIAIGAATLVLDAALSDPRLFPTAAVW